MDEQPATRPFIGTARTKVGRFTYRPATKTWTWSEGVFLILGFEPGEVVPTTDLLLRHLYADDLEHARASGAAALTPGRPFTFPHRLWTAARDLRVAIAVGHVDHDDEGQVVVGHLVDITDFRREAVTAEVDQAVQDFAAHRSRIEQAKGVLMQLYSVDADTAWHMLRAYSQDRQRKVRVLAEAIVDAASNDRTPAKSGLAAVHDLLDHIVASR